MSSSENSESNWRPMDLIKDFWPSDVSASRFFGTAVGLEVVANALIYPLLSDKRKMKHECLYYVTEFFFCCFNAILLYYD